MPRLKKNDRPQRKEINLPRSVVEAVNQKLLDRYTGLPVHGGWSELVEKLLKNWLEGDELLVDVENKQSSKPMCVECLKDLPLTAPCNRPECKYETVTDGTRSGTSEVSSARTASNSEQVTSTNPRKQSGRASDWTG